MTVSSGAESERQRKREMMAGFIWARGQESASPTVSKKKKRAVMEESWNVAYN